MKNKMSFNLFKFIKDNVIFFLLLNIIIITFSLSFLNKLVTGEKYEIILDVQINNKIKNTVTFDIINYLNNIDYKGYFIQAIANTPEKDIAVISDFDHNNIILTFLTYNQSINEDNFIQYINKVTNIFYLNINSDILKFNKSSLINFKDDFAKQPTFFIYDLFAKNFYKEIDNAESIKEIDDILRKIEKNKTYINASLYTNLKKNIFSLEKINEIINDDKFYPLFKISNIQAEKLKKGNIYFKNFEYIFIIMMAPISIIGSFVLILILNYNNLRNYII